MKQLSEKIRQRLTSLGVVSLYLFGSRAMGLAGPLSDFDFGVLMEKEGHRRGDAVYEKLYDILSPICPRTLDNDTIDIVFLDNAPLELQAHVVRYGKILLDANPLRRGRFEEKVIEDYCDFRPVLDLFDRAILASL